jgi:Mg2+-importing ATPase
LNNILSDVPLVFIATDNVDAGKLTRAQRWRVGDVRRFMIVFGLLSTVFDLTTFFVLLKVFGANQAVFQTTWFVVSLLTELAVVMVLRTDLPAIRSRPSAPLLWFTAAVIVVALSLPYLGPLASVFSFVPLPLSIAGTAVGIVSAYVLSTEAVKAWFFRHRND